MEKWKRIDSSPKYEVSDLGRVRHIVTHEPIKLTPTAKGYLRVPFGKIRFIHRLVAVAFLPPDPMRPTVNHKDDNKNNNRKRNLVWATWAENNLHSVHKRHAMCNPKRAFKLTPAKATRIRNAHAKGERSSKIAKRFGVSPTMVRNIAFGRSWITPTPS
jgi:hypothetical protein